MYIAETVKYLVNRQPVTASRKDEAVEASCEVEIVFQDDNRNIHPAVLLGYYDIIPQLGSYYDFHEISDTRFILTKHTVEKLTGSGLTQWWKVTLVYDRIGSPEDKPPPSENEFSDGVNFKRNLIKIPTVFSSDVKGNPVLNSSGMPFDTPYQRDRYLRGFTITRQEYINPLAKCDNYERRTNSVPFWGFPKGTVLVEKIDPGLAVTGKQEYFKWDVTYDIIIDTGIHGYDKDGKPISGHEIAVLDNGTRALDDKKKLHPILDDSGVEIDKPVPLDGKGKVLKDGKKNVYIRLVQFEEANLNELCLPNPYLIGK